MRFLADIHISPLTVHFLRHAGYDVVRINEIMPATSTDPSIIEAAILHKRTIIMQDLDFSRIIMLSGKTEPSLISLRLSSSRVEHVNEVLNRILPVVEQYIKSGALITVEDDKIRVRLFERTDYA